MSHGRWPGHPATTKTELTGGRIWPWALVATIVALAVYRLTLAPDLTWANAATDGGELITASVTLGVPHPPGYPIYILLGKLFSFLPVGSVAFRYNLFSAVCAAAAIGLLAAASYRFWSPRVRPVAATAAALAFAFLPLVWSQAVVTEVYSLNLLMLALFLLTWSRRGPALLTGLWLGLAVTAHLTSVLMLPAALISSGRQWFRLAAGVALGLTALLLLPLFASGNSPVVWGRPDTVEGWWWLVSGRLYAANLQFPTSARLLALLQALAIGPALVAGRRLTGLRPAIPRIDWTATGPRAGLMGGTAALYVVFAAAYATPDAAVLLLPALILLALLLAPALERLGAAALLLPLALAVAGYPGRTTDDATRPRLLAEAVLEAAPSDALILAPGDRTIFTLWYFQHVEGRRPDLRLVDASLFAFDWYRARLAALNPDLSVPADDDLGALQRLNETERPFCTASLLGSLRPLPAADLLDLSGGAKSSLLNCFEARH